MGMLLPYYVDRVRSFFAALMLTYCFDNQDIICDVVFVTMNPFGITDIPAVSAWLESYIRADANRRPFVPEFERATPFAYLSQLHDVELMGADTPLMEQWDYYFGGRTELMRLAFRDDHPDLVQHEHHFMLWNAIQEVLESGIAQPVCRPDVIDFDDGEEVSQRDSNYVHWIMAIDELGLRVIDTDLSREIDVAIAMHDEGIADM